MGFRLKVQGTESIDLGLESILTVEFETDTPDDSNARSTDLGVTVRVTGKILAAVDGDVADDTMKLTKWALVRAEEADCYRNVTIDVIAASQIVRQITLPNAFVVDYTESFGDEEGVGQFSILIKQKKDKTAMLRYEGGFGE
jgi:hypothetical protein